MAERHQLALSLSSQTVGSPAGTATAASSPPPEQQPRATVETERARRRHTSRLYAELGALLPHLPARATQTRILEAAIAYVGALRGTVAELEERGASGARRRRAAAGDGTSSGGGAPEVLAAGKASCFFAARVPAARRPGALTRVLEVFRHHGVPVLAATVTTNAGEAAITVTTAAVAPSAVERIKADISSSIA